MKRIRIVELLANIRSNFVPFLSISLFVALGVGLFLGIQWGAVALQGAFRQQAAAGRVHDIEIQFPYGLTEDDLAQLKKIEGVDEVEQAYSTFATMGGGGTSYVFRVQSLTEGIDTPDVVEGKIPVAPQEMAILASFASRHDISVGDRITFKHDAAGESGDKDGMETLTADSYTVTALVNHPAYLAKNANSFGISSMASGLVDCVAFVTRDAFDAAKFRDAYPSIFVRSARLEGMNIFSPEYREAVAPMVDSITELGKSLGTARFRTVRDEAQGKLDEAESKVTDGERQLVEGEQKLKDGEQDIADGEKALAEGKEELTEKELAGARQLADSYAQLVEGQARYDAGVSAYNTASDIYNQVAGKFDAVRGEYDVLVRLHDALGGAVEGISGASDELEAAIRDYDIDPSDEHWNRLASAFDALRNAYGQMVDDHGSLAEALDAVSAELGFPVAAGSLPSGSLGLDRADVQAARDALRDSRNGSDQVGSFLDRIAHATISVSGVTISLLDIPGGLQAVYDQLEGTRQTLESSKAQLDAGWAQYEEGKATYDRQIAEGKQTLEDKTAELQDGKDQLVEGKKELEDKTAELNEGKDSLADAKEQFKKLVEYEWIVMPITDNGGMQSVTMVTTMMGNVRWAMALLFVLVGLFVCYSVISRLVHEQIVGIGTKKALGFRSGEITSMYLGFSGLSVVIGVVGAIGISLLLVQGVMNPTAGRQYTVPQYAPHFDIVELLIFGVIEFGLILLATLFAIHGLLKREALDLLRGESTANVKEHFYERWGIWNRLSLFSKTVVSNCVNDPRRVVGTLVGVIGCTALIVMAVTLSGNISLSIERHYEKVYDFDSIVYLSGDGGEQKAESVAMGLYRQGIAGAPALMRKLQFRQSNGARATATIVVPTNEFAFHRYYHVLDAATDEPVDIDGDGIWLSAAYQSHMNAQVGDEIVLTESTGKTHTFEIAGFFDFRILRPEFLLSRAAYEEAFGEKAEPNVLLMESGGADLAEVREALSGVEGYESLVDDHANAAYMYNELNGILRTVVLVYLILSGLMAVMVLLNLDIMFVDEKKRELIVLMINGFSTRQAQAYIYRDSIVLTVIGIALGVVVGSIAGGFTVSALEPEAGHFVKDFNGLAAIAGIGGAGVFAASVLIYALRKIPRFDLTDINRF